MSDKHLGALSKEERYLIDTTKRFLKTVGHPIVTPATIGDLAYELWNDRDFSALVTNIAELTIIFDDVVQTVSREKMNIFKYLDQKERAREDILVLLDEIGRIIKQIKTTARTGR